MYLYDIKLCKKYVAHISVISLEIMYKIMFHRCENASATEGLRPPDSHHSFAPGPHWVTPTLRPPTFDPSKNLPYPALFTRKMQIMYRSESITFL